jgi:hypothetical protein
MRPSNLKQAAESHDVQDYIAYGEYKVLIAFVRQRRDYLRGNNPIEFIVTERYFLKVFPHYKVNRK